jgi:hypothetical protein
MIDLRHGCVLTRLAKIYSMREVEETAEALEKLIGAQAVGPRAAVRGEEGRVGSKLRGRVEDAQIVYSRIDRSSPGSLGALVNARHVMALRN